MPNFRNGGTVRTLTLSAANKSAADPRSHRDVKHARQIDAGSIASLSQRSGIAVVRDVGRQAGFFSHPGGQWKAIPTRHLMTFQDGAILMNRATEANATTFDIQTFQNTWKSRLNLIEDSLRSCSSTDFQSFAMNKDRSGRIKNSQLEFGTADFNDQNQIVILAVKASYSA